MKLVWLTVSHAVVLAIGFALGVYALPILIAPRGPATVELERQSQTAQYKARFRRELKDSDSFHWGDGVVFVSARQIGLTGELAPGPDYKLYLSPEFIETEADFKRAKPTMVRVADVKTFKNFLVTVPDTVDIERYTTVVVWCETFSKFITAARYK